MSLIKLPPDPLGLVLNEFEYIDYQIKQRQLSGTISLDDYEEYDYENDSDYEDDSGLSDSYDDYDYDFKVERASISEYQIAEAIRSPTSKVVVEKVAEFDPYHALLAGTFRYDSEFKIPQRIEKEEKREKEITIGAHDPPENMKTVELECIPDAPVKSQNTVLFNTTNPPIHFLEPQKILIDVSSDEEFGMLEINRQDENYFEENISLTVDAVPFYDYIDILDSTPEVLKFNASDPFVNLFKKENFNYNVGENYVIMKNKRIKINDVLLRAKFVKMKPQDQQEFVLTNLHCLSCFDFDPGNELLSKYQSMTIFDYIRERFEIPSYYEKLYNKQLIRGRPLIVLNKKKRKVSRSDTRKKRYAATNDYASRNIPPQKRCTSVMTNLESQAHANVAECYKMCESEFPPLMD